MDLEYSYCVGGGESFFKGRTGVGVREEIAGNESVLLFIISTLFGVRLPQAHDSGAKELIMILITTR